LQAPFHTVRGFRYVIIVHHCLSVIAILLFRERQDWHRLAKSAHESSLEQIVDAFSNESISPEQKMGRDVIPQCDSFAPGRDVNREKRCDASIPSGIDIGRMPSFDGR